MEKIEITLFTEPDEALVRKLNTLLVELSPSARALSVEEWALLAGHGEPPLFLINVDGEVAGMLALACYRTPTGCKWWIEDVVVDASMRGKGLARRLVRHALDHVRRNGGGTVWLTSRPERVAANGLYASLGFSRKETNVYRMTVQDTVE